MTLFEYMSVAISIVMSLAVVRVVSGISHTVAVGRRYWVHPLWMAVLLLVIALHWWNLWAYRDFDDWNFLVFVSLIIAPGLFCFQAVLAIFVLCLLLVAAFWFFYRPGDFPSFWQAARQLKGSRSSAIASLWQLPGYTA